MNKKVLVDSSSPILWCVLSLLLGGLLIAFSDQIIRWVMILAGAYLMVLGAVPLIRALIRKEPLPLVSLVAAVSGLLLIVFHSALAAIMFILFGLLLLIVGIQQLDTLIQMKRSGYQVTFYHYFYPILAVIAGVISIWNPFALPETLIAFVGWCLVIHGLLSLLSFILLRVGKRVE